MPFESEKNAVRDSDGAENPPPREDSDLPRRQDLRIRGDDLAIMKKEAVHGLLILAPAA